MNILTDEEIKSTLDKVSCCLEDRDIAYSRAIEATVMSKLAEQSVEPIAFVDEIAMHIDGYRILNGIGEVDPGQRLYSEVQMLAAQQKAADACAKVAEESMAKGGAIIAKALRNGEWREYL